MAPLRRFQLPGLELEATLLGQDPGTPGPDGARRCVYLVVPMWPYQTDVVGPAIALYLREELGLNVHEVVPAAVGIADYTAMLWLAFTDEPAPADELPRAGGHLLMASTYAWVIDRDLIFEPPDSETAPPRPDSRVGLTGPRNASPALLDQLRVGRGHPFRMLDGDGEVCYEGRLAGDPTSEDGFGPLDDLGEPDAGCTSIEYLQPDGEWEKL